MISLRRIIRALDRMADPAAGTLAVLGMVSLVCVESIAPRESSLELFYIAPVALGAWRRGRIFGMGLAVAAALLPAIVDYGTGNRPVLAVEFWNTAMRLGIFTVVVHLLFRLRVALERLKVLASTDDLTGAANARTFHEHCRAEMARARRHGTSLTLLYLDLDDFKAVNDEIGHLAGDAVLKTVVETIRRHVRPYDIVARMGGDEFAVLFPDVRDDAAAAIREKIRDVVASTMARRGFPVTCSIGSVTFSKIPKETDDLIRTADDAMSEAKRRGKNTIVHRGL